MTKKLTILFFFIASFTTLFAVNIPKGTFYFDNSKTQYSNVKFVFGNNDCVVVQQMTYTGSDNIWKFTMNDVFYNASKYFFSNTELADGFDPNTDINTIKDAIALDRGEKRTATKNTAFNSEQIFVPNNGQQWAQGSWVSPSVDADCDPHSKTLPVLYLQTDNGNEITSKEEYLPGNIYIDALNIDGYTSFGTAENRVFSNLKGRGNWTWNGFDKKPYRIKMNSKASLLNLSKNKSYAVLAHADDSDGFLRNTIGFALSRILGLNYTPGQEPVELFLNNNYKGIYFLTDQIKVSEHRLKMHEQRDLETDPELITGGWLLEIDNYETPEEQIHILEKEGSRWQDWIWFTYKSPDILSQAQVDYITDNLTKTNAAIYNEDKNSTEWEKYVDIDTLVNFYIINELMANGESFHGSCYLHKDRGENTKWVFGPVWDFGNSFRLGDEFIFENPPYGDIWIDEIVKYPRFQQKVAKRWSEIKLDLYSQIEAEANAFVDKIEMAAACDCQKWPSYGNHDLRSRADNTLNYVRNRIEWLNTQWPYEVSVPEADVEIGVSMYPNPATEYVNIVAESTLKSATLIDMASRIVQNLDLTQMPAKLTVQKGTYLLRIITEKGAVTKKLIVY